MTAATERLYHHDSFARELTATVVAVEPVAGGEQIDVVLDRTVFYPEAGGQMADHGELAGARVVDVQADAAGVIRHRVAGAAPAVGAAVTGAIDWARRRQNMAQHTGQHILSAALLQAAGASTTSARLGDTACTIDVDKDRIDEALIARAEELACSVIDDDVAIRAWFPSADELAALTLRREPKVETAVRVIAIGEFDVSPCGGTHCARSAQVGPLRILGVERYKGGTRVTFAAGTKARAELAARDQVLRALASQFTCGPGDVPVAVDKLRRDLAAAEQAIKASRERLAEAIASGLLAGAAAAGPVVAAVPGDGDLLRAIAPRLVDAGRDAVLAGVGADGVAMLVARATGSSLDCGKLVQAIAKAANGRGGGRPDRAEGRLPAGIDWPALVARCQGAQ
jgi:alanyl-tRNA synthetase